MGALDDARELGGGVSVLRDRFRDPLGWFMDVLPWSLRKYLVACRTHERPRNVPRSVRFVGWRKPSREVIEYFRRLEGLESLSAPKDDPHVAYTSDGDVAFRFGDLD